MRKLVLFLAVVVALGVACFPQNCTFTFVDYCGVGDQGCTGHLVDPNTWESGPFVGTWLDYGPNTDLHMHLRDGVTGAALLGDIQAPECYVSPTATPNTPGGQFAQGAGNLCQFTATTDSSTGGWQLDVTNNTCAQYYVYVKVTSVPAADASTD